MNLSERQKYDSSRLQMHPMMQSAVTGLYTTLVVYVTLGRGMLKECSTRMGTEITNNKPSLKGHVNERLN